jgi:cyclase
VLKELAQGVYVETGFEGGNVGVVLNGEEAFLVDTPMLPPQARQWQWTLRQLGVTRIAGIVNTDYHPEHILGNTFYMPTKIWGHELSLRQIGKYKPAGLEQLANLYREQDPELADEITNLTLHTPELCVQDHATLYLGERTLRILHLDGHTPVSLGVYLPEERILFAGDNIVYHEHPIMAQANSQAWLESLNTLQELEIEIVVPGLGEPCTKEAIAPLARYIGEIRRRVSELFEAGASRRECVEKVSMIEFYPTPEEQAARIKRRRRENVERVYTEIRTAQKKR